MAELKIRAINVNGIRDKQSHKAHTICHVLGDKRSKSDITILLDTRLDSKTEHHITRNWERDSIFIHNTRSNPTTGFSNGIAVLFHNALTKVNNIIRDRDGQYAIIDMEHNAKKILLVPIYAPANNPKTRIGFFNFLNSEISKHYSDTHQIILLGDFNVTENDCADRIPLRPNKDPSVPALQRLLSNFELEDSFRTQHPDKTIFTFRGTKGGQSRIDRIYTDRRYRNLTSRTDINFFAHSDHDIISITLRTSNITMGKGTWHLDNKILTDTVYQDEINALFDEWQDKKQAFPSLLEWWDALKRHIKNISRKHTHKKSIAQRQYAKSIDKRLQNLRRKIPSQNTDEFITSLLHSKKQLEEEKARIHMDKTKSQWLEEGEKCSQFFLNLENKRKQNTLMYEITDSNGKTLTTSEDILAETKLHYQKLYTRREDTVENSNHTKRTQNFFLAALEKHLTIPQASLCDREFTRVEIKEATFGQEKNKSAGPDGLPIEFYHTFWDKIEKDFLLLTKDIFHYMTLTESQRQALIISLPKKGLLHLLDNWRPLSMLNADYKIIAKTIANRLSHVLPHIIHEDQTCSVTGRKIQHSLSLIRDMIAFANTKGEATALLSIDQMKAFDKVNWTFLDKILHSIGFGETLITWVRILYTNITSAVKVNGHTSEQFTLQQGVRQGCPLSPFLYVIYSEALAAYIRRNKHIRGITVDGTEIKLSQYADDMNVFTTGDESLTELQDTLNNYEIATGAVINPDKSHGLWLGKNKNRKDKPLGYKWSDMDIKILGLHFGSAATIEVNFNTLLTKFSQTLHSWQRRNLSLKGRVIVVNQLALSKLVYAAHIFPCSRFDKKLIENVTNDFISGGKRTTIDNDILYLPVALGGLGLHDFNRRMQAQSLQWITELYRTDTIGSWKTLMTYFLSQYRQLRLGPNIFKTFLSAHPDTIGSLPPFYQQLIKDWLTLTDNRREPVTQLAHIYHEPLFHNIFITIEPDDKLPHTIKPPNWYPKIDRTALTVVGDICHQYKQGFHTHQELTELINYKNVPNFTDKIIKSIPLQWHRKILHEEPPKVKSNDLLIKLTDSNSKITIPKISTMTSKTFYNAMPRRTLQRIQQDNHTNNVYNYTHLEREFGSTDWKKLFTYMYKDHIDKKTTDIQYKAIHGKILDKVTLLHMKIQKDALCNRCNTEIEDVIHLFHTCTHSKEIWAIATYYINGILGTNLMTWTSYKWILLGFHHTTIHKELIQPIEDIRLAYFYAVWFTRNEAMWHFKHVPGKKLFRTKLTEYITHRQSQATHRQQTQNFLDTYGKIYKSGRLTQPTLLSVPTPPLPVPHPTHVHSVNASTTTHAHTVT